MSISTEPAIGFVSNDLGNGFASWTLTTRLGHFLKEAEELFGPRDPEWAILGIEFYGQIPHVWFPGNANRVAIRLSLSARENPNQALFQLAHETVHLLSPTGSVGANVLEEGLATWFADQQMAALGISMVGTDRKYAAAKALVSAIMTTMPSAISEVRKVQSTISQISTEQLIAVYPQLEPAIALILCQPFNTWVVS